jgi:hypothetical protein
MSKTKEEHIEGCRKYETPNGNDAINHDDVEEAMDSFAEQQSIAFHNWTLDNHYMSIIRNKERMFFQPMQAPLHTHAELYQLFLNDQNK